MPWSLNIRSIRALRDKKDSKVKKCKYGFPYDLLGKDGLDSSGIRYNYARFSEEDRTVVPCNKELLSVWDGHVNVQRVTQLGLVRYLVKYVSKIEPTFQLGVKERQAEVDSYFSTRLIGAPEVVTTLLSYQIAGGTRRIIFLDTNFPGKQQRVMKSMAEINLLQKGSTEVFSASFREKYLEHPDILDDVSYPNYLAKWEVFGCASKVPKSRQSRVLADRSGRSIAPRDKELIPRWRFLTPLSGE